MQTESLSKLLGVCPGLTAIVGGGGKTSLLYALARELQAKGRVIVTTSTKIRRPTQLPVADPATPEELRAMFAGKTRERGFEAWMKAFCEYKYTSDFSVEMSRSVRAYLAQFGKDAE